MTRYLLDTNIISNFAKPTPSRSLIAWLGARNDADLFIASMTIAEIRRGVLEMPPGRRRAQIEAWFAGAEGPQQLFAGRILPFDERAAMAWAALMAEGKATGKSRNAFDTILAAVAQANDCIVVTDNDRHFPGVRVLNPMRDRA